VRNAIQVLRLNGFENPHSQWACELIDRQAQAMSRLIDDLMDVSRINQGKLQLQRRRVQLADILQDALETSRPVIDEHKHHLELSLPAESLWVDADPTRLAQAFMNLLNNAAKYTDPGGRIEVAVRESGGEALIAVSDTGIGIPAERLEAVFEMFSQIETALTRSRGGLGIGLSLTRRLVEMHGGSVEALSHGPGQGSQFIVRLPIVPGAGGPAPAGPESIPDAAVPAHPRGLRILVADDNRDAAESLAAVLQIHGHVVRSAHDGESAIREAEEFLPEIVLLDIGMPKINGYDVCRRIRSGPATADAAVIAITGWSQPLDRQTSREAGFDHHLVKPVDPVALTSLLARLAARQPAPQDGANDKPSE
jgi:CheY-like chemotaxis protein